MTSGGRRRSPWPRLLILAVATEALYLAFGWASSLPVKDGWGTWLYSPRLFEETPLFYLLWVALVLSYALAISAVRQTKGAAVSLFVFLSAASFRATLLLAPGFERSATERLLADPHKAAPLARTVAWSARALTRRAARLADPAFNLRLLASTADLAALAILPGMLKGSGLAPGLALVHGWNPLAIKESAGSGHLEAVALVFLAIALRSLQRRRVAPGAAAYGASLTGSLALGAPVPAFARAMGPAVLVSLVVGASGWGLSYLLGSDWPAMERSGGSLLPATTAVAAVFLTRNPLHPLALCLLLWGVFVASRALGRGFDVARLPLETLLALGGWLMISPRVFPWSFVPLAFLAGFSPNPGWLVFTATSPLGYFALAAGADSFWLGFGQYFPAYFVLIFGWLGARSRTAQA